VQLSRDIAQRMRLINRRDFLKRISESAEMKRSHKRFWLEYMYRNTVETGLDEAMDAVAVIKGIIALPIGLANGVGRTNEIVETPAHERVGIK